MYTLPVSANPSSSELLQFLMLPTALGELSPEAQQALQAELELVRLSPNATLFRQGDPGDSLYVLVQGKLAIRMQNGAGADVTVDEAMLQNTVPTAVEAGTMTGSSITTVVPAGM